MSLLVAVVKLHDADARILSMQYRQGQRDAEMICQMADGQEADLPSDRPYLFGYHPHGIIGMYAVLPISVTMS